MNFNSQLPDTPSQPIDNQSPIIKKETKTAEPVKIEKNLLSEISGKSWGLRVINDRLQTTGFMRTCKEFFLDRKRKFQGKETKRSQVQKKVVTYLNKKQKSGSVEDIMQLKEVAKLAGFKPPKKQNKTDEEYLNDLVAKINLKVSKKAEKESKKNPKKIKASSVVHFSSDVKFEKISRKRFTSDDRLKEAAIIQTNTDHFYTNLTGKSFKEQAKDNLNDIYQDLTDFKNFLETTPTEVDDLMSAFTKIHSKNQAELKEMKAEKISSQPEKSLEKPKETNSEGTTTNDEVNEFLKAFKKLAEDNAKDTNQNNPK